MILLFLPYFVAKCTREYLQGLRHKARGYLQVLFHKVQNYDPYSENQEYKFNFPHFVSKLILP